MFSFGKGFKSEFVTVIFINIIDDAADPFDDDRVVIFKINHDLIFESEKIEIEI